MLGITGKPRKDLVRSDEKQAEEGSRWIWNKREEQWMSKPHEQETKATNIIQSTNSQYLCKTRKNHLVKTKLGLDRAIKSTMTHYFSLGFACHSVISMSVASL